MASCGLTHSISPGHSKAQQSREVEQPPQAPWFLWLSHFPEDSAGFHTYTPSLSCHCLSYSYPPKLPAMSFILLFQGSVSYLQSYC